MPPDRPRQRASPSISSSCLVRIPLLFHTGLRRMFPLLVREAVSRHYFRPSACGGSGFGHYEADECGSMNEWLAVSAACRTWRTDRLDASYRLNDMADRAPRIFARRRNNRPRQRKAGPISRYAAYLRTAGMRASCTRSRPAPLLCGDLFTQVGDGPALTWRHCRSRDRRRGHLQIFKSLNPSMGATVHRLCGTPRRANWPLCTAPRLVAMGEPRCAP